MIRFRGRFHVTGRIRELDTAQGYEIEIKCLQLIQSFN
jgi:hypothetical protein